MEEREEELVVNQKKYCLHRVIKSVQSLTYMGCADGEQDGWVTLQLHGHFR